MKDEILSYREMCEQENVQTLQKGMNYRLNANYTVILMSQRNNAPYKDRIYKDGLTIEYEGHDIPRSSGNNPKILDQQQFTKIGNLTENGKFIKAIEEYKKGKKGLIGLFMGEVMKVSKGKADPKLTNQILSKKLNN